MFFEITPLDRANRVSALIMFVILVVMLVLPPLFFFKFMKEMPPIWVWWIPVVIMALILLGVYGFAPTGYELSDTELAVRRRIFGRKYYPLSSFTAIEETGDEFKPFIQKAGGAAGLFGYSGTFRNRKWGRFEAQATNSNHCLILLGKRPLIVSPAEKESFKEIVETKLKQLKRSEKK